MKYTSIVGINQSKALKVFRHRWQLHVFMLFPCLLTFIFSYIPMFGVQIAFKNFIAAKGIWGSEWVGLSHFEKFFNSYNFTKIVTNTIGLSVYSLVVGFPLPILFALVLNIIKREKLKKAIQTITYIPHFISTVVLVGLIMQVLSPVHGLYGSLYRLFSLGGMYPSDIIGKPSAFSHLYVWSGVWQNLGWNSIIYSAALSGVDPQLHEAAQIDGATQLQRIFHIDLPSIMPTAAVLLIMSAGSIMDVGFEKVYLMQNGLNLNYSEVISTYVYKVGMKAGGGNFSYAAAIGLFNSVVNCVLLIVVNFVTSRLSHKETSLF